MATSLRERINVGRIHRINVVIEYEGEPITDRIKSELATAMGDCVSLCLRDRHPDAQSVFTLGLHQDQDVED